MNIGSNRKYIIGTLVATALVSAGSAGILLYINKNDNKNLSDNSSKTSNPVIAYKNGTYSATGTYPTGGGRESISLTVRIDNGIITNSNVNQNAISPEAKEYQKRFVSAYKEQVIGRKIDEVSLSRVAGSSLTSIGFNKAITRIKSEASQ